jgi:hypothetical protein
VPGVVIWQVIEVEEDHDAVPHRVAEMKIDWVPSEAPKLVPCNVISVEPMAAPFDDEIRVTTGVSNVKLASYSPATPIT